MRMADWSASASCGHWPNLRSPRKQTIEIELPNRITQITDSARDLHEDVRDVARALAATPEYMEACRRRKKVCAPQAYPAPYTLAPQGSGSERSQRRISARGHRSIPKAARPIKTDERASGSHGRMNTAGAVGELQGNAPYPPPKLCSLSITREYLPSFSTVPSTPVVRFALNSGHFPNGVALGRGCLTKSESFHAKIRSFGRGLRASLHGDGGPP